MLAHYVADAHQPFHAAVNYDGQLTGQWGDAFPIRDRAVRAVRIEGASLSRPVSPVGSPREFVFAALTASFPLVQQMLDADKAAVAGREFYDDGYFVRFFAA